MSDWLRVLLGLNENEVPPDSELRFELGALSQYSDTMIWLVGLVLLAVLVFVVVLYRREATLSVPQRLTLTALRLLALALVVLMLLDPRLHTEITVEREATTIALIDTSGSMSRRDTYEGKQRRRLESLTGMAVHRRGETPSRLELAHAAMERVGLLEGLAERNDLRVYAFDAKLRSLEDLEGLKGQSGQPVALGGETRLGDAVTESIAKVGANPIAALVVVSDGQSNAGAAAAGLAPELERRGVPVHAVAVGKSQTPQNYAVVDLAAPEVVEVGYPVRLRGRVQITGIRGSYEVTLERRDVESGVRETLERRDLENETLAANRKLSFLDTPETAGRYEYTLTIKGDAEETDRRDNRRRVQVIAAEEKRRILLVAGNPSYEYRHVRNLVLRDPGVQASCWLASADRGYIHDGDVVIDRLPNDPKDLQTYDVVILLDPDPGLFSDGFLEALDTFVSDQGGGLVYVAGECHTPTIATRRELSSLRRLLAVNLASRGTEGGRRGYDGTRPFRAQLTTAGAEHPLCQLLEEPTDNAELWAQLSPFYFAGQTRGIKPAAKVLLQRDDDVPLAAIHRAGAGFSLYLGTDDLYRWRASREGLHERFWAGIVRFMAYGKRLIGSREASLDSNRDRYQIGEEVVIEASLTNAGRDPVLLPQVDLLVEREPLPDASTVTVPSESAGRVDEGPTTLRASLRPIEGRPGAYQGRLPAEHAGYYTARIESVGSIGAGAEVKFVVTQPMAEWDEPAPNHGLLEDMALQTRGRFWALENIADLPAEIPDRSVTETVGRAASTVWDSATVLLLLCGAIILEWCLRKWWRLN